MKQEELTELIMKFAVLMQKYEHSSNKISDVSMLNAETLAEVIRQTKNDTLEMLGHSEIKIRERVDQAIAVSFDKNLIEFEERMHKMLREFEYGVSQLSKERASMTRHSKFLTWQSVACLAIGCVTAIGLSSWFAWRQTQVTIAQKKAWESIEYRKEVLNAIQKVNFNSCGGRVCVKLDQKAERWGKESEYVIVE